MSLQTFLSTVEHDLEEGVEWVENETDQAATYIWKVAVPLFTGFDLTVVQTALAQIVSFMSTLAADLKGGTLADIETAFMNDLQATGSALLPAVKSLGSNLIQILIGLARGV